MTINSYEVSVIICFVNDKNRRIRFPICNAPRYTVRDNGEDSSISYGVHGMFKAVGHHVDADMIVAIEIVRRLA